MKLSPALSHVVGRCLQVKQPAPLQGLPVFVAPGEAEATCAALDAAGLADACATADADALLFGARRVLCTLHLSVRAVLPCVWCVGAVHGSESEWSGSLFCALRLMVCSPCSLVL